MGKIICLMGKSSTGKNTVYRRLLEDSTLDLETIVPYTTRPIREGERDGVEYFFTNEEGFRTLEEKGKIIEDRIYHTVHGPWRYFTADDGQIQDVGQDYILIATLEAYGRLQDYFGRARMIPVLLELEDGKRLRRALDRELSQQNPRYEEMCRRFLADCADFSEERIRAAGIGRRFANDDLEECLGEIREYIISRGVKSR